MRSCRREILFLLFLSGSFCAADVAIQVDAAAPIRTITESLYGGNLTAWDGMQNGTNATFNNLLKASGRTVLRWPGGSWGNCHLWSDMRGPNNKYPWKVTYGQTLNLLGAISHAGQTAVPELQPIVNFPGYWYTDNEHNYLPQGHQAAVAAAAAWVQDQSARTPTARYWEIGNEIGGPWEAGWFSEISGTYYGDKFADFYLAMKAVNPDILIGAVAEPYHGPAQWGWYQGYWTYDTLAAASAKGAIPDYLIVHQYPGDNQAASYNPTLLGARVNDIGTFTANMNGIVASALGAEYVGQIGYAMTEWDSGQPSNNSYERRKAYVNALFHAQYIMEMARHKWILSNAWAQWEYNSSMAVYPVWYVHPLLIHYFGREMVEASSSAGSALRAYAAKDTDGHLTLFLVNNSPTAARTAAIGITGFAAAATGQRWLIEPAGELVTGGVNIQDLDKLSINGIAGPDPLTFGSITGEAIAAGNSFSVTLPAAAMMILRIPPDTGTEPDTTPPSPNPMGWAVKPYATGATSIRMQAAAASDISAVEYYFACTFGGGNDSGWQNIAVYEDTGLAEGQTYTYTVTARDKSANQNTTLASVPASAVTFSPEGTIDTDGYYVMGSRALSGFSGAAASGASLHFDGMNGTISGIGSVSNPWWIQFAPVDRNRMPYSLPGAAGWKMTLTNTSSGALQLFLAVSAGTNYWQLGDGLWLEPGQSGTLKIDIAGIHNIHNYWIIASVPGTHHVLTFNVEGIHPQAAPWRYGDFDGNHQINGNDLARFAALWLWNDCALPADFDLNGDCVIGLYEFAQFARNWLENAP